MKGITTLAEMKKLLQPLAQRAQAYFAHASGQALVFYTVATHDVSKWEAAIAAAGALTLTSTIKKINAWLKSA